MVRLNITAATRRNGPIAKLPGCLAVFILLAMMAPMSSAAIFIRANQVGYAPKDAKLAVAFSTAPLPAQFTVIDPSNGQVVYTGKATPIDGPGWGQFNHHAQLDFSSVQAAGKYILKMGDGKSLPVQIEEHPYQSLPNDLLDFMHEQQCGYNPWLNVKCHQDDGRTAFGPLPAGTKIDVTGGWHDAGDMLKYLMTSQESTAEMLLAYTLGPKRVLADRFNALGQPGADGMADVLDEAHWGLEWMLKMHPAPDQLYHQVADDRDHAGFRLPQDDDVDYGWGKGKARVVYFADGKPQGLRKYKSASTGVANIAGVYSAAMALAYQIWKDDPAQKDFADRCLKAGEEVYAMGRAKPGVEQGDSYLSPYRYCPTIWAQDMEWGAAELYRATGKQSYLDEAIHYAKLAADDNWMGKAQTEHYQYFPFINIGHYRLYDLVDDAEKSKLADYYRAGIDRCIAAGQKNPYRVGVPFIWCSNNLVVALVNQCKLYQRMTGDDRYQSFSDNQRDWLLGRNPWGTTMFSEIGQVYPHDVHLMTVQLLHRLVRGGLVDGPVYEHIFKSLRGVTIRQPDPLAAFQGPAVYHDDGHDYSSNEPTLDGTASAILMFTLCAR